MERGTIQAQQWRGTQPPKKVLVIRLQALGDAVITIPYVNALKALYPDLHIDFCTREEVSPVFRTLVFIDRVFTIGGRRNAKLQFLSALMLLPTLWKQGYDVVVDLQNNRISTTIRRLLFPAAWSAFDRFSPSFAGDRTLGTIRAAGFPIEAPLTDIRTRNSADGASSPDLSNREIIVLNPAGYCPSRNWPLENYIAFARKWLMERNENALFVLLLLPQLSKKADKIREAIGAACVDFTGKADQVDAFSILKKCTLVLTEDSGLMHMAWVQGVPTLALFSSSSKVSSRPGGSWSMCLDSSDMGCGPCFRELCKYGDNRCITRYSPAFVFREAVNLLQKIERVQNSKSQPSISSPTSLQD